VRSSTPSAGLHSRMAEIHGAYGVLKFFTASKAYRDLAEAASKADKGSGKCTKVLAVPSSVSLNLHIISDLVLSGMDDAEESGSKSLTPCLLNTLLVPSTPCYLLFSREENQLLASPFNPRGRVVRYNGGSISLMPLHPMCWEPVTPNSLRQQSLKPLFIDDCHYHP
jgi:hypothetical protein